MTASSTLTALAEIICRETTWEPPYPGCKPGTDCACWRAAHAIANRASSDADADKLSEIISLNLSKLMDQHGISVPPPSFWLEFRYMARDELRAHKLTSGEGGDHAP